MKVGLSSKIVHGLNTLEFWGLGKKISGGRKMIVSAEKNILF
jgi:hypothetical protein